VKRTLRRLGWVFAGFVFVVMAGGYAFREGWHVRDQEPEAISNLLRPHDDIFKPDGDGPFPTAILVHGCSGLRDHTRAWGEFLVELGWASVAIDSYTGRGETWQRVCAGRALLGAERAGDLLVTLADIRRLPFVDPQRIALIGWSHGAWATMELLAMDPPTRRPTNLSRVPDGGLDGVIGSVLFYPYCGFGARSPGDWASTAPALFLLSGKDQVVSTPDCIAVSDELRERGLPVRTHVYPDAPHSFDAFDTRGDWESEYDPRLTEDARRRVAVFLAALP
jgi:dienelactone hydrolase